MECDICGSNEENGTVVKADEMSRAAARGYNPYVVGFPSGSPMELMARMSSDPARDRTNWTERTIGGSLSTSDWYVCPDCMAKLAPYQTSESASATPLTSHMAMTGGAVTPDVSASPRYFIPGMEARWDQALLQRATRVICEQLSIADPQQVTCASVFSADLAADELDIVEIVMALEQEFGINITGDDDITPQDMVGELLVRFVMKGAAEVSQQSINCAQTIGNADPRRFVMEGAAEVSQQSINCAHTMGNAVPLNPAQEADAWMDQERVRPGAASVYYPLPEPVPLAFLQAAIARAVKGVIIIAGVLLAEGIVFAFMDASVRYRFSLRDWIALLVALFISGIGAILFKPVSTILTHFLLKTVRAGRAPMWCSQHVQQVLAAMNYLLLLLVIGFSYVVLIPHLSRFNELILKAAMLTTITNGVVIVGVLGVLFLVGKNVYPLIDFFAQHVSSRVTTDGGPGAPAHQSDTPGTLQSFSPPVEKQPNPRVDLGVQAQSAPSRFCPQCGFKLLASARFCTQCGVRLEVSQEYAEVTPKPHAVSMPTAYRVRVVAGVDKGKSYPIGPQGCSLGRERNNAIVLEDVSLSRNHCAFELQGADLVVRDLMSANGTLVNGLPISSCKVVPGSRITVGDTELLVETERPTYTSLSGAQSVAVPPPLQPQQRPPRRKNYEFSFEAMTRTKEKVASAVIAANKTEAIRAIERMGYVPIRISEPKTIVQPSEEMDGGAAWTQSLQGMVPNEYVATVLSRLLMGICIIGKTLFSFKGRISRLTFGCVMVFEYIFAYGVSQLILMYVLENVGRGQEALTTYWILACVFVLPWTIWSSIAVQVKRWHDRGKPGKMVFINFIPAVGLVWALIELGFLKGTTGANEYGDDPVPKTSLPLVQEMFSLKGRLSCIGYWRAIGKQLLLSMLISFAFSFVAFAAIVSSAGDVFGILFAGVTVLFWGWTTLAIHVKRWHDRGRSGWMFLVNLIPVLGALWSFIELGVLKGKDGGNAFGPDPLL